MSTLRTIVFKYLITRNHLNCLNYAFAPPYMLDDQAPDFSEIF